MALHSLDWLLGKQNQVGKPDPRRLANQPGHVNIYLMTNKALCLFKQGPLRDMRHIWNAGVHLFVENKQVLSSRIMDEQYQTEALVLKMGLGRFHQICRSAAASLWWWSMTVFLEPSTSRQWLPPRWCRASVSPARRRVAGCRANPWLP